MLGDARAFQIGMLLAWSCWISPRSIPPEQEHGTGGLVLPPRTFLPIAGGALHDRRVLLLARACACCACWQAILAVLAALVIVSSITSWGLCWALCGNARPLNCCSSVCLPRHAGVMLPTWP
jgi:hypothetical protein